MAGSSFGTLFRVTTWGESHGKGIGVVVDGCPAGLELSEEDIQVYLDRRKPGQSKYTTKRKEADQVHILSGVFEGKTTGTPISLLVWNEDQRSKDYGTIKDTYRPGHADYTFDQKYGFRDYRGGGRSSGRETIARVAAGAIACKILEQLGVHIFAYTSQIGEITIDRQRFSKEERENNPLFMPDATAYEQAKEYVDQVMSEGDSAGGVVECVIKGLPAGIGEPVFDKLNANLAKAVSSIGGVKGVEIGDGFLAAKSTGSQNNDSFTLDSNGAIAKETNHSGGILGGMSDGDEVILRAGFKPIASISKEQRTVNRQGEETTLVIGGRHDPLIVPRAVVVVETMVAITIVDMMFLNINSKMENIIKFYK